MAFVFLKSSYVQLNSESTVTGKEWLRFACVVIGLSKIASSLYIMDNMVVLSE